MRHSAAYRPLCGTHHSAQLDADPGAGADPAVGEPRARRSHLVGRTRSGRDSARSAEQSCDATSFNRQSVHQLNRLRVHPPTSPPRANAEKAMRPMSIRRRFSAVSLLYKYGVEVGVLPPAPRPSPPAQGRRRDSLRRPHPRRARRPPHRCRGPRTFCRVTVNLRPSSDSLRGYRSSHSSIQPDQIRSDQIIRSDMTASGIRRVKRGGGTVAADHESSANSLIGRRPAHRVGWVVGGPTTSHAALKVH